MAIPTYEQRGVIGGISSAPRASTVVPGSNAVAGALGGIAQAGMNLAGVMQQKEEDKASQDVANVLSTGRVYWQQYENEKQQAWNPGDPDLRDTIASDFDKWRDEQMGKLSTPASKRYFEQHTLQMRERLLMSAYTATQKKITDKLNADTMVAMEADEQAVFANPASMMEVLATRAEATLARRDIPEDAKASMLLQYKQKLALAAEMGRMEQSPEQWYLERFGGLPESVGGTVKPGVIEGEGRHLPIANAIYGQESSYGKADTSKVNSQNVTGPMQMMEGTFNRAKAMGLIPKDYDWKNPEHNKEAGFAWVQYLDKKYDGDPAKVAAAYYGGEGAVGPDGQIKRHWRNKQRPQDPTVGEYVDQVLARIAKDQGQNGVQIASATGGMEFMPGADKKTGLPPAFASLPWEQQIRYKQMAEQRIQQDYNKRIARLSIETAKTVVDAQDIGVSGKVDDAVAVSDAVAQIEANLGRQLQPEQVQAVEAQVARAARQREQQRKTEQDNIKAGLFDALESNGGDFQQLMAQNMTELAQLPRDALDALQKFAGDVATGGQRVTDWQAYAQLIESPDLLMQTNLAALKDKFSRDEFNQLVKLQQAAVKAKEEGRPQTIQSDMAVVKDLLQGAKVKANSDDEAKFFAILQREMDAHMAATGKTKMSQKEVKELAADLLTKEVTKKGFFWDSKELAYNIEIPPAELPKIDAALQAAGLPVNDSTRLRVYRNKLQRQNSK